MEPSRNVVLSLSANTSVPDATERRGPSIIDEGMVSQETFTIIYTAANYVMYPFIFIAFLFCLFGIVVYSTKQMRSATNIYLLGLNVAELAVVTIAMTLETTGLVYGIKAKYSRTYLSLQFYFSIYLATVFRRTIYCLSCLLSAERFIVVVFPLRSKHCKIVKNPTLTVIGVMGMSVLLHVYVPFKYVVVPINSNSTAETLWEFQYTDIYASNRKTFEGISLATKVVFVGFSLTTCSILNVIIAITLRRNARIRRTMTIADGTVGSDQRITITVLVSTCVLLILELPANVSSFVENTTEDYGTAAREHYLFHTLMRVGRVCELISACTGFIFYMTLSAKFRQTFYEIFCSRLFRKPTGAGTSKSPATGNKIKIQIITKL